MELSYAGICFDLFGTLVTDEGAAIDGARATLRALGSERWAIVTSCPRTFALALIARAGLTMPPVLVSADEVARGKPAPDPYTLAAKRLAIEPAQILVVEDSTSGVDAARAAGMDVVYVLRGRPASSCPRADYYVERFDQIGVAAGAGAPFVVALR